MSKNYRMRKDGEVIDIGDEMFIDEGWTRVADFVTGIAVSDEHPKIRCEISDSKILEQKSSVIRGMKVFGGGFMSSLGLALTNADRSNTIKIYQAWPDDWAMYNEMGNSVR